LPSIDPVNFECLFVKVFSC